MDDGGSSTLKGAGQLWHACEHLAEVRYELSQSTDPMDPVSITDKIFGVPEEKVLALLGQRLTLRLEDGEAADCFFTDSEGRIVLTVNGLRE
jgi:hypothetical protein